MAPPEVAAGIMEEMPGQRPPTMRLTPRDREVLADLWRLRYLSTAQVSRLHFGDLKRAQRRLRILHRHGLVDRFQPEASGQTGFRAWWYRLARPGARVVAEDAGLRVEEVLPPSRRPRSQGHLAHHSLLTDVRLWLREGCQASGGEFGYEFIPSYEEVRVKGRRQRRVAIVLNGAQTVVPDGALLLTRRSGKSALFLLEVDRGTEPLTGRHKATIEKKLGAYASAFDAYAEEHYRDVFQHDFSGFRVLFTLPDGRRLDKVLGLAHRLDFAPLVWATTNQRFQERGDLDSACWAVVPGEALHRLTE